MSIYPAIVLAVLLAIRADASAETASSKDPPNVTVFLLDTLRPDALGFYGHPTEPAPFLASRAAKSVVFERAYSTTSWTPPAIASLFTGLSVEEHGVIWGTGYVRWRDIAALSDFVRIDRDRAAGLWAASSRTTYTVFPLAKRFVTMAEAFRDRGYFTYTVQTNGHITKAAGFDQGFDKVRLLTKASGTPIRDASVVLEEVEALQPKIPDDQPVFAYIHLIDPHMPYNERDPYYEPADDESENPRRAYQSEISYLDHHLKQIYETTGSDDNTIVVFVSDHGEEFGDHGGTGHGFSLYNELNQILFMIEGPNIDPARSSARVSIMDVYPTLAELVGLHEPKDISGVSLVPLLQPDHPERNPLLNTLRTRTLAAYRFEYRYPKVNQKWSAMSDRWKLIETVGEEPVYELYDLENDPLETENRYGTQPEVEQQLRKRIEDAKTHEGMSVELTPVSLDDDVREALEAMGYL